MTTDVELAFVFGVSQVVDGETKCVYCDDAAVLATATGADPEAELVCYEHGMAMMDAARRTLAQLFGPKIAA